MSASAVTAKESRASIWLAGVSCADGIRSAGTSAAAGKGLNTVPACPRTLSGAGSDEIAAAVSVARLAAMRSLATDPQGQLFRSRAGQHDLNQISAPGAIARSTGHARTGYGRRRNGSHSRTSFASLPGRSDHGVTSGKTGVSDLVRETRRRPEDRCESERWGN